MLTKRSQQPEWMDLGSAYYTPAQYNDCLRQLDRIGQLLGGDRATFRALDKLSEPPRSILDIGCGGGALTIRLGKAHPSARVVGIDIAGEAISFAERELSRQSPSIPNVEFHTATSTDIDSYGPSDVVMATLVCHHLSDQELVAFLRQTCKSATQAVILNDLHRHILATAGFAAVTPFLFPNRMIWHDGLLSIRRSFTRQEWKKLLEAAGIAPHYYTITWQWAFRWIVMIDVEAMRRNEEETLCQMSTM